MSLSQKIKAHRQAAGLTQEQVAEAVGVSRQAVAKWERGLSAPSTENLVKLCEAFGIGLDELVQKEPASPENARALYELWKQDRQAAKKACIAKWKKRLLWALGTLAAYGLVYLVGRIVGGDMKNSTFLGWLTGWQNKYYLPGWLQTSNLFLISALLSAALSLFGKTRAALASFAGFCLGILLGEALGVYPPGIPYGHGHYGWAIWGGIFLASLIAGGIWQWIYNKKSG